MGLNYFQFMLFTLIKKQMRLNTFEVRDLSRAILQKYVNK